ncbi:MAG: TolC family protein [Gemmatimonadota bacterium]
MRRIPKGGPIAALLLTLLPSVVCAQATTVHRLSLGDAARRAAAESAPVLEARARIEAAQARVSQRTGALLPRIDADVTRGARTFNTASFGLEFPTAPGTEPFFDPRGEVVGPVRSADVRTRAEIPVVDPGALGRRRSAQAGVEAARADARARADAAAATAARAYVAALRATAEVEAREEDLSLAHELLEIARGQFDAGVGVAIDVTRAESQVATIQAQLLAARHRVEASQSALRYVLRLPDEERIELTDALEEQQTRVPDEGAVVAEALERRSDLGAVRAASTVAQATVAAERATRLPRVSVAVDEGVYGRGFERMLNTYSWGLRVTVPLFDGLQRSARVREGEAIRREMDLRAEDLEAQVRFQVRDALLAVQSAEEQVRALQERLRLARLEVDQEEERVRAGVAGTGDVVRAAMRLNDARTAYLDVLSALHNARIGLAAATGTVTELP